MLGPPVHSELLGQRVVGVSEVPWLGRVDRLCAAPTDRSAGVDDAVHLPSPQLMGLSIASLSRRERRLS